MRLHSLDSLRGIFALMVVLLHFPADWTFLNHPLVRNDGISVDFFFVLSGFVVSLVYADRLQSAQDMIGFLIRRVGRIWPLHAFVLIMILGLEIARYIASTRGLASPDAFFGQPQFWPVFFQDMFFLNAFRSVPSFDLNFPAWSIGAEFWTYVVFGITVWLIRPFAAAAVLMMGLCFAVLSGWVDPGFGDAFGFAVFRSIFYFLVGYFTYRAWQIYRGKALPFATLIEIGTVLLAGAMIWHKRALPAEHVSFALLFAGAIFVFAFQAGAVSRLLMTRPFQKLGERSYSIYLLHILVLTIVGTTLRVFERVFDVVFYVPGLVAGEPIGLLVVGNRLGTDLAVLAMLALIVWVSGYTYRFIEQPGQEIARRLAQGIARRRRSA